MASLAVRLYRRGLGRSAIMAAVDFTGVLTFQASPDHADVTSYEVRVYIISTSTLVDSLDLGKPTPDGTDHITVDISAFLGTIAPGNYTVTVAAISPGGTTESSGVNFSLPL